MTGFDATISRRRQALEQADVELVSMPWTSLNEPSLGLGILVSVLGEAGLTGRVRHLNLSFLKFMQPVTYATVAETFALNDFLFSGLLDPGITTRQWGWLRSKVHGLVTGDRLRGRNGRALSEDEVTDHLVQLRHQLIPAWLVDQADVLARSSAPMVGFTCMFDQTVASIALAQLIKKRAPDKLVVLGGYAVREPTASAVLRAFDWVDVVCTGEGEPTIVPLALAASGHIPLSDVPGVLYRGSACTELKRTVPGALVDLAHTPCPDYDDFFVDVADLSADFGIDISVTRLPVENSRGCWWGEIRHCVFCGIHDDDLRYRVKSPAAALRTMDDLSQRYGVEAFRFSDYILPRSYFESLLPLLASRGAPYSLTAEMKANVGVEHFALLASAGFVEVQPGIESFSTRALKGMDKGTTPAQNAQTLLLGHRHDVKVNWNLLYGFPDDDAEDMEEMLETLSRLTHLDPPATRLPVQVTRFAPLQVDPDRFGIPTASYDPSYDLIFSSAYLETCGFDLGSYCYYFARPFGTSTRLSGLYRRIDALVDLWHLRARDGNSSLTWQIDEGAVCVSDSRWQEPAKQVQLSPVAAVCLLALERPRTQEGLRRQGFVLTESSLATAIAELDRLGLVIRDGKRWMSLVLPADPNMTTQSAQRMVALSLRELTEMVEP